MKSETNKLPIFPLSVFLLPGGITRLRVFEPRYLKMVSIATNGDGFIISAANTMAKDDQNRWGSWVEIINFDQGEDGVLEIDVKCKSLVSIKLAHKSTDNLQFVETNVVSHWSQKVTNTYLEILSSSLLALFDSNPLLNELYTEQSNDNAYWVVARWLELLPIPFDVKNDFVFNSSYIEAKKLVNSIIID